MDQESMKSNELFSFVVVSSFQSVDAGVWMAERASGNLLSHMYSEAFFWGPGLM